ncbi:MAG: SPFH domain-containing protein [Nanoarchaeota archaeon]
MSTEEPELSESSDEDTQNKFYLESPHEEMIIETRFLKLLQIRSGQEWIYWRRGKLSEEVKGAGWRIIFSPAKLWGSGMVINTVRPRNEHIEVKTVQTGDYIDVLSASASLYYRITDPKKTVQAAYDSESEKIDYKTLLIHRAEADLRQFVLSKKLKEMRELAQATVGGQKTIDTLSEDTKKFAIEQLGITADALLYRRIDLPPELEARLAEATLAAEEAEGRLNLAKKETEMAAEYAKAAEFYEQHPKAMDIRRLQSLDNLVETQRANPNLFIGVEPFLGLTAKATQS